MRKNLLLGVVLTLTILLFCGAAVYVVYQGKHERNNICSEVQDLRDDIVQVLDLGVKQAKSQGRQVSPATQQARDIIGKPSC